MVFNGFFWFARQMRLGPRLGNGGHIFFVVVGVMRIVGSDPRP